MARKIIDDSPSWRDVLNLIEQVTRENAAKFDKVVHLIEESNKVQREYIDGLQKQSEIKHEAMVAASESGDAKLSIRIGVLSGGFLIIIVSIAGLAFALFQSRLIP